MEGLIYLLVAVFVLWIVKGMLSPIGKDAEKNLAEAQARLAKNREENKAIRAELDRFGLLPPQSSGGSGGSGGVPPKA